MIRFSSLLVLSATVLCYVSHSASATTLIEQTFGGASANLSGTAPTGGSASGGLWKNGASTSGNKNGTQAAGTVGFLTLSEFGISITSGHVYDMYVTLASSPSVSNLQMYFDGSNPTSNNVIFLATADFLVFRNSGTRFQTSVNAGSTVSDQDITGSFTPGSTNAFRISYDTTGANAVVKFYDNNTQFGSSFTYSGIPAFQTIGWDMAAAVGPANMTYFAFAMDGLTQAAVPEPSTYAMGLVGLAGLGLVAWRKRRARS